MDPLLEPVELLSSERLVGNLIPSESNKGDLPISGDGEFNGGLPSRKFASM